MAFHFYEIQYSFSSCIGDDFDEIRDPDHSVTTITGQIAHYNDDGDETIIGRTKFFYVDFIEAEEHGIRPDDVLDAHSSETASFINALFNDDVPDIFLDDDVRSNLLIFDRIEIIPEHRGKGITSHILNDAVKRFLGDALIVALKAFPLQNEAAFKEKNLTDWQKSLKLHELENDQGIATRNLIRYYEKLGFEGAGRDNIMIKPIWTKFHE